MTLYFTREHEWMRLEGNSATVGTSTTRRRRSATSCLPKCPRPGASLPRQEAAVVESVKAASDVYAPVGGTVTEANQAIVDDPSLINHDPEREGWFFRLELKDPFPRARRTDGRAVVPRG